MRKNRKRSIESRARDRPQATAAKSAGVIRLDHVTHGYSRAGGELAASEVIYSAVTRIANALATMPICLYHGNTRLRDDPRDVMLSLRPNRLQSAYAFKQAMEIYRNTEGRAYAVKRFDDGFRLRELEVIDPARVTPLVDRETGDGWYAIARDDGETEYLHGWYVLSLWHASTNGQTGIRVVDVLRSSIEYNAEIKEFSLASLKAVNRGIILEFPTHIAGPAREKAAKEFLDLYRKSGGAIIALDSGVKASTLTMSPIDSAAFDVEKVTRSRVAMVYNLPPSLLGDTSSAGKATSEEQTNEFLTLTMQPIVQQWEDELNFKLLTPEERAKGYELRIDVEAYLRTSPKTRAEIDQSRIRCGLRTVNECRAKDYLDPIEGGDVAMVSKDLAPVELVARGGTIDINSINGDHNAAKGGTDEKQ